MEISIKIRPQGRTQLAVKYSPDVTPETAWRRLKLWIKRYPELGERLHRAGYRQGQRIFTSEQVSLIIDALGEP